MFVDFHDEKCYIVVAQLVFSIHSTWFESQGSGETKYFWLEVCCGFCQPQIPKWFLKTGHPYPEGFEVLTLMVMKSSIFWDIMPRNLWNPIEGLSPRHGERA
jgi:hypothetical protein